MFESSLMESGGQIKTKTKQVDVGDGPQSICPSWPSLS